MADPSCNEVCSVLLSILHSSSDLNDSSKNIHEESRGHARTEAEGEDDFEEPNCRICLEPAQIGEKHVNPLLSLGCHCHGDLAHAHKRCLEVWFASRGNLISPPNPNSRPRKNPKELCEICRGDLSTAIVTMVDNYAITSRSSSQYQLAGGSAVVLFAYPHLQLHEYSQRIVETIFGAAGIAIILVLYVYVEVWCNF